MEADSLESVTPQRNWLYIISPCIIAAAFSLLIIVLSFIQGGWSFIGVFMFSPFLLVVVVIDILVKAIVNKKVLYVWLVEILLIAITIFLLKQFYIFI